MDTDLVGHHLRMADVHRSKVTTSKSLATLCCTTTWLMEAPNLATMPA